MLIALNFQKFHACLRVNSQVLHWNAIHGPQYIATASTHSNLMY